jgi:glutamate-1-semialdehyde 2,1-aminomutase
VEAIKREVDRGLIIVNLDLGVEVAELLTEVVPCAELVRLRNTGTEVCMASTMVARAFTGKDKIIKFYGNYHGVAPEFMVGWASHTTEPTCAGIPLGFLANTVVLPYNDIEAVRRKLDEDEDIGAVITDPVNSVGGIFPPRGNYLQELRQLTSERGVVLIFDEVITGFRLALGGAQEYFGVIPDLACYAKAIAGGQTFAAFVGKEDVMGVLGGTASRAGTFLGGRSVVYQSGTMNETTAGIAAAIASINVLKRLKEKGEYENLNRRTSRFATDVEDLFRRRGIGCYVNTAGSYYKIHFTDVEPTFDVVCGIDKRMIYLFTVALMAERVMLCSPGSGSAFLSFAHTEKDISKILEAINTTLDKYKFEEILWES